MPIKQQLFGGTMTSIKNYSDDDAIEMDVRSVYGTLAKIFIPLALVLCTISMIN